MTAPYGKLPAVQKLLQTPWAAEAAAKYGRAPVREALRQAIAEARSGLASGYPDVDSSAEGILDRAGLFLARSGRRSLRRVVNATGTVLHTNLGRAPLAPEAIEAVAEVARGYSTLEYDVAAGRRGERHAHVESLLCELTGAEAAFVVNNNAAAVLLALCVLAQGKRAVVSRGELVEIGGSFRMSDVMEASGAELVEIGTTNRTHEEDYERALAQGADLVVRVHTSNFRIVGFTCRPPLSAIVAIARAYGVPVIEDLGSGSLLPIGAGETDTEPTVRDSVAAGADLVLFSGDKLLGASQAGILCGRRAVVERLKRHPFARAMRVDKLTLAALEATLMLYRDERMARARVPVLALLARPLAQLREDARRLATLVGEVAGVRACVRVTETVSRTGGGALPGTEWPSLAVAVAPRGDGGAARLCEALRKAEPPIVARVEKDEVILDVRTIFRDEHSFVADGFRAALARCAQGDPVDGHDGQIRLRVQDRSGGPSGSADVSAEE
jgi:L-seryl-tRNA(Ser) seleniumtransferase